MRTSVRIGEPDFRDIKGEPFREQRRTCSGNRRPRGPARNQAGPRRAVPGHVRHPDHGRDQVRAPVRTRPRPHHEPAHDGDAAGYGPGTAADARGHALGVDGHTPRSAPAWRREELGRDPILGHRHPPPLTTTSCRARAPCWDAPQTITEPVMMQAAQARGAKVRFDTEYLSHEQGRLRRHHPGPRPAHRHDLPDPLRKLPGGRGRRPQQGRGRPGPAVRGPGRGRRARCHIHLRGRP